MRLFILLFLAFCFSTYAQDIAVKAISKTTVETDTFVGVDEYKSLYHIKDNIFYKKESGKTYQFNDFQLGDLTHADILNPLKIVLFYEDTNTAVILDNTLSEIKRINFNQINEFRNIQFATTGIDRNLWVFNLDLQQLELYDYNRDEIVANTQPISETIELQKSNYNFCWLLTKSGIQKYNIYGSLMSDFKLQDVITFTEKNGNLVIANTTSLYYLKKGNTEFQLIKLPKIDVKQLFLDIENLYLYDGETLHHYQLQLPKN
ncbi:hypothetical protein [Croceibacter atlanticus]|jgi:hypothetical protein|uniref:hypothetical protein n=1 Tax=Croceibacter atlanticus TaxID=313588 RepID=UPI0024BBB1E3|nr:hypothetical protein [Croceibacter atlanticus]|tara:strand:- start:121 stop:903 length:783 start_codon:yes stop_codon:yes gene_type:complete